MAEPIYRKCEICPNTFILGSYDKKRFCSKSCSARFTGHSYPKRHKTALKYVSKRQTQLDLWKQGKWDGLQPSGYKISIIIANYIREKFNYACVLCNWKEVNPTHGKVPTQIDHIDGNSMNNKEENLRLLCPNCHSLTPTFGALNYGNGRQHRREVDRNIAKKWCS